MRRITHLSSTSNNLPFDFPFVYAHACSIIFLMLEMAGMLGQLNRTTFKTWRAHGAAECDESFFFFFCQGEKPVPPILCGVLYIKSGVLTNWVTYVFIILYLYRTSLVIFPFDKISGFKGIACIQ